MIETVCYEISLFADKVPGFIVTKRFIRNTKNTIERSASHFVKDGTV